MKYRVSKYRYTIPEMARLLNVQETTISRRIVFFGLTGRKRKVGKGKVFNDEQFLTISKKKLNDIDNSFIDVSFEKYDKFFIIQSKMNYESI